MVMKALAARQGWNPGSPDEVAKNRVAALAGGRNGGAVQLAGAIPSSVMAPPSVPQPWTPKIFGTNEFGKYLGFDGVCLNPDPTVRKKGFGIYGDMLRTDDMCSASTAYLLLGAISPGWRFDPGDQEEGEARRAADFQDLQSGSLKGTFQQMLLGREDSAPRGVSLGELVWADRETEGEWDGKQRIGQVQDKNMEYINFKLDDFGQVIEEGVVQETTIGGNTVTAELEEVMYWPFWPRDDNPYGTPLLGPAYQHWFFKHFTLKQWARTIEQLGHPVFYGVYDNSEPISNADKQAYLSWVKELRQNLAAVMSNAIEIKEIKVGMDTVDMHIAAMTFTNRSIARSLLLPALVMEKDSTGSLALGREQGDQFAWIMEYIASQLEAVVNAQYVLPSHLHNFGPNVPCPVFKINAHKQEDLQSKATTYGVLATQIGVPFDIRVLADEFGEAIALPKKGEPGIIGGKPVGAPPDFGGDAKDISNLTAMVYEAVKGKLQAEKTYSFASPKPMTAIEKLQDFAQQEIDREADLKDSEEDHILITEAIATDVANLASEKSGERLLE